MTFIMKILILGVIAIAFVFLFVPVNVDAERNCDADTVCVQTGDYLQYEFTEESNLIEFNESLLDNKINFKSTRYNQDGIINSEKFHILDRNTGMYFIDGFDQEMEVPLIYFLSKDMVEDIYNQENCQQTEFDFNGINRNVFKCNNNEGGNVQSIVDIDTRIIIQFIVQFGDIDASWELIDTNIFESNNTSNFDFNLFAEPEPTEYLDVDDQPVTTFEDDELEDKVIAGTDTESRDSGGGCLIATATYGSELAPEVQKLRELRDNSLLNTESGTNFMSLFNDVYYSFSPIIADYERENPVFKEMVKVAITPMITSLSILNHVNMDSESKVLGYGISLIILNAMMYVGIPVLAVMRFRK